MKPEITPWQYPPSELVLKDGELHLWRFGLDSSKPELDDLRGFLAADEIIRADRLLDLQKKKQFIVARARLREILGHYQKVKPQEIKFQYNTHGKPALSESLHSSVSFNLSHSGHWGTLAVVNEFAVGIDLEQIEAGMVFSQVADRYFNDDEKLQLAQYPPARQRRGFYRLWTQKEAMLKAEGVGFQIKSSADRYFKIKRWYLRSFPIASGFICSVATTGKIVSIQKFHFQSNRVDAI
ncbi:MAG: hypothetical protein DRH07_04510 [Deltaproteobacteria bacterium]|nr:MAG: hypothetical protein DRH07_04510 [Deltaproteobacteria bacterium]